MMVCDMNQILESALKMGFSLEELNSVLLQKMKIEDLRDAIIRNARNHTAWQNEEKKKPTSEQQVCESAVYEDDVGLENFCFSFWCKKKLKTLYNSCQHIRGFHAVHWFTYWPQLFTAPFGYFFLVCVSEWGHRDVCD